MLSSNQREESPSAGGDGAGEDYSYYADGYEDEFEQAGSIAVSGGGSGGGGMAAGPSSYPQIFLKEREGVVRLGGSGGESMSDYDLLQGSSSVLLLTTPTPTVQGLWPGIDKFVYTGRETFCDIMCTTNTCKEYVVAPVKNLKIKDTVATLPVSKKFSFASLGKGETPWQRLRFEEARQKRNEALKRERDEFLEQLGEDRAYTASLDDQRMAAAQQQTLKQQTKLQQQKEQDPSQSYEADFEPESEGPETETENGPNGLPAPAGPAPVPSLLVIKLGLLPAHERSRKLATLSKEEERRLQRETHELQDELISLASSLQLGPIKGLTLEPRGKASRRRRQIEHAAVRRLQRWARMLAVRSLARARCDLVRHNKRDRAARTITRFFHSLKMRSFKANLQEGMRNDAARVIQCAGRKFVATHRVRVLRRLALRRRLEKHAVVVIHRSARRKLRSLEPRKALAELVVTAATEGAIMEAEIADAVAQGQTESLEDTLAALATLDVERYFLDDFLAEAVPAEHEALLVEAEARRLQELEEERIALEMELIRRAEEEAAAEAAAEAERRRAVVEEEERQAAARAEKRAAEEARRAAEREEKAR